MQTTGDDTDNTGADAVPVLGRAPHAAARTSIGPIRHCVPSDAARSGRGGVSSTT